MYLNLYWLYNSSVGVVIDNRLFVCLFVCFKASQLRRQAGVISHRTYYVSIGFHTGLIFIGVYRLIIRKLIYLLQNGQNKSDRDFAAPNDPNYHFHPSAGLFGILRKSVIWPFPSVNFVISSLIWTLWDTAEVSVSFFGAPKHLWFCILVGTIHRFHNGNVDHSNRISARPRWNCIVDNHEQLYTRENYFYSFKP